MKKRVVITGIGAVSPQGHTVDAICNGEPQTPEIVPSDHPLYLQIANFDSSGVVSGRLKRKLDNFSVYGLCAASMAMENCGLLNSNVDLDRVGVFVGNCLGGWGFTEPKIKALHTQSVEAMGPYVATAWFPAALQGQISLKYGLKGYSKTFSANNVAGLQAIGYAVEAIQNGRTDAVICGASEDLSSPYVRAMLARSIEHHDPNTNVFGHETPSAFGEGAAFLVLESYEQAIERGAKIYCEVGGFADHFCADSHHVDSVLKVNIAEAINHPVESHLLLADGVFDAESTSINALHESVRAPLYIASNRQHFGNMFAVSGVMETVCAAYDLRQGTSNLQRLDSRSDRSMRFSKLAIRRLSKQGNVTTLGLTAI